VSNDFSGWLAGTLAERTIEDAGVVLERQTYAYGPSGREKYLNSRR
jgi:hypothetical protein